ncbi:hypothetical protein ACQ4PT_033579 [Festuca glaucescens]
MGDNQTSGAPSDSTAGALTNTGMPSSSTPAVNVMSVRTHVPVTLDLKASNFTKWRMLVCVLLGKYDLLHHVNTVAPPAARTPEWIREDYIVRSWLYGSISDEILDIIMAEEQTAQEAWGDLSITGYCHRLKALSDALRDVGTPVTDQALILNCLRGLNPRFADITTIVTMQNPLPTFAQTRSLLTLRETQLANSSQVATQTALYGASSNGAGGYSGSGGDGNRTGGGNTGGGNFGGGNRNGGGNYRKKKNDGNSGGTSGGNSGGNRNGGQASLGPWVCFNPYTGQAQQMQGPPMMRPTGAGLLGPRPMPPASAFTSLAPLHGQAFGTHTPPVPYSALGSTTTPAWDTSALMAALNNAATPSTVGEWVMDSGATAHMASDPGSSHQGRDH